MMLPSLSWSFLTEKAVGELDGFADFAGGFDGPADFVGAEEPPREE